MPWIIGIDEAGYGPNLGPLVMTSAACRVPDGLAGADLWHVLRAAVRRAGDGDDGRLLVADSKEVYNPSRGLRLLETGVLATLASVRDGATSTLAGLLAGLTASVSEVGAEPWYTGRTNLPQAAQPEKIAASAAAFHQACSASETVWGLVRAVIVCPTRFNAIVDRHRTKGAVLGAALAELLRFNHASLPDGEEVSVFIDKHGGRNNYAPMLQTAFDCGMVVARCEGMEQSTYTLVGAGRELSLTFQPRADSHHFCVALASMVSKYLRELLMGEFNRFWQMHVPGLKPTAGYPVDAERFMAAIRPAADRLGFAESSLWRHR